MNERSEKRTGIRNFRRHFLLQYSCSHSTPTDTTISLSHPALRLVVGFSFQLIWVVNMITISGIFLSEEEEMVIAFV